MAGQNCEKQCDSNENWCKECSKGAHFECEVELSKFKMLNLIWRVGIIKSSLISMKMNTLRFWRVLASNLKSKFPNFKFDLKFFLFRNQCLQKPTSAHFHKSHTTFYNFGRSYLAHHIEFRLEIQNQRLPKSQNTNFLPVFFILPCKMKHQQLLL